MKTVKIFEYRDPAWGYAFTRISDAFHQHAPSWVEWTDYESCDIMLVHVVGKGEILQLEKPKPKVIIQHCYWTAQLEEGADYISHWEKALMTASFHDLQKYTDKKIPHHNMPWGADPAMFKLLPNIDRDGLVFGTGFVAETEGLDLVFKAAQSVGGFMFHTGAPMGWDRANYIFLNPMDDSALVEVLNSVKYISALRFVEGFELLGIEGLMCGARPIVPDAPTYDWYRKHAYTIDTKGDIVAQLTEIFKQDPRPISAEEYQEIVDKFSWTAIMGGFYKALEEKLNG